MATRFYFRTVGAPSAIAPAFNASWGETAAGNRRTLVTGFVTPDAFNNKTTATTTPGNTAMSRQYISFPMVAGLAFTTSTTYKCQIQGSESAANDNITGRVRCVRIFSRDGGTVRSTQIPLGNAVSTAEWVTTGVRNLTFLAGNTGANYTTAAGDRLVVELGHQDTGGASVSGDLRYGAETTATGDVGENETDTTTTLRGWFETSLDLAFERPLSLLGVG